MTRRIAFTYLFWGFLFQMVDFYLQGVNLFPDVFGFILSVAGLRHLRADNRYFNTAYLLCFPLVVVSLPNVYRAVNGSTVVGSHAILHLRTMCGFAEWCLAFLFVFYVCKGIQKLANRSQVWDLVGDAALRWRMFVGLQVAIAVIWVIDFVAQGAVAAVLSVGLLVYDIIVAVSFMTLMWACRTRL